ncbi:Thermostable carboxypeptidase 1 [hydrothermal vent metagenome]|uniref:Thermostable carboxypeptidase 1 n=1 Tax=hydrothermal vent metagenome TaxID=652676 RepID=A0A3B0TDV0_9ZZZZ
MSAYAELEIRFARLADIEGANAVLSWDRSTQMPDGGATVRGRQMATLSVLAHEILTQPAVRGLLDEAEGEALNDWQAANLAQMVRANLAATAVPADLVGRIEEARAATEMAWRAARAAADFSQTSARLDALLGLVRQSAACLAQAKGVSRYDALLDQFDPGLTYAFVAPLFDDLEAFLPPIVDEIIAAQAAGAVPVMPQGPFDPERQKAFGAGLMAELGFDFNRGRLDVSHHPFSGGVPDDCRITTRYDAADFSTGLMGIIHETGHALYEQGLPARWRGQPVGRAAGMTMHESQSLIMEMQLGRSKDFIAWLGPRLAKTYGGPDPVWSADNLRRLYLKVARRTIRVDADEASYPLHVILRTRLERALLSGDLAVADLPAAWNDGMKAALGVVPKNDAEGCLQDIHWYMGAMGYFPTYTLGALTAAQMKAHMTTTAPDTLAAAGRGDFAPLVGWLRENVHRLGRRYGTAELIARATGAPLGTAAFKAHIEARYLGAAT